MNWINIHTDTLRSVEYLGSDPIERATWLNLLGWCATQENGGIIEGAAEWKDRKWQQLCGITKEEATLVSELYHIGSDGNMYVNLYPADKEAEVKRKRDVARENGKKGGRPPNKNPEKPSLVNSAKAEREGKGKVKEGEATREDEKAPPTPSADEQESTPPTPLDELKTKINALRPEWQKPALWSYAEEQHLHNGTAGQMAELDADDWHHLARFFKAYLDNAKAYWRPNSRSKFVETFADVWAGCQRWRSKHKPRVAAPVPVDEPPAKPDPSEYVEDIAEYKAATGCTLTPQQLADDPGEWKAFLSHYFKSALQS